MSKYFYLLNYYGFSKESNYFFDKHYHNNNEIMLFIGGNAQLVCENFIYECKPFDLLLIPSGFYHYIKPKDNSLVKRYVLEFEKIPELNELINELFSDFGVINSKIFPNISNWFSRVDNYKTQLTQENMSLIAKHLIMELLFNISYAKKNYAEEINLTVSSTIFSDVITYIKNNFTSINSIDDIVKTTFISKTYLFYLFKKNLKESPIKYVNTKKILYAHQLIMEGMKPTQASILAGFSDYTTFFRLYKKQFGQSPSG